MMMKPCSRVAWVAVLGLVAANGFMPDAARGQDFIPTEDTHSWNVDTNWSSGTVPDSVGAATIVPGDIFGPTDDLTVTVDNAVTIGSLLLRKPTGGPTGVTTIAGPAALTFDNGESDATLSNSTSGVAAAAGESIVSAPLVLNSTLAVTQHNDDLLSFTGSMSGSGGLTVERLGSGAGGPNTYRTVVLGAANSYEGQTVLRGVTNQMRLLVVLEDADAIPAGSNLRTENSVIMGLAAGDFTRALGTGPGEFQIGIAGNNHHVGWAAFGEDRVVNIGGLGGLIEWGVLGLASNNFMALGNPNADKTIVFQNNLRLTGGATVTNRSIRVYDGEAAIDARITGSISTGPDGNDGAPSESNLQFIGAGTISLANANTYRGATEIFGQVSGNNALVLRLDHPNALPAADPLGTRTTNNLHLRGSNNSNFGGVLGLGDGWEGVTFDRALGSGDNEVRLTGGNAAGFAAFGGDRAVNLGNGQQITWGDADFSINSLTLGDSGSDGIIDFQNPIDLGSATRTVRVRTGGPIIDARLSGVLSGSGGGLEKLQPGTLEISGENTYTGDTIIDNGALVLTNEFAIPGGITAAAPTDGSVGDIVITSPADAGAGRISTIGLGHGDFTRQLGTGGGKLSAPDSLGFAAYGADRAVNLGGASAPLVWAGTPDFVSGNFALGATSADAMVDFQNPINLNGEERTIFVRLGTAPIDARLSGVISGTGGSVLRKEAGGTLELTAANTYEGGTILAGGRLLVNNSTGSGVGTGDVLLDGSVSLGGHGFIGSPGNPSNITIDHGTIRPGDFESLAPAELTVYGNISITSEPALGFFHVDLADGSHGKLTIDGTATIAGTLLVSLVDGFTPTVGTTFEILTATGGVNGTFDAEVFLFPESDWLVTYNPNSIVLTAGTVGLFGDHNRDGVVDAADYVLWRKTGIDGQQGYDDWRANFGAGAGGGAASALTAVPEPATLVLLAVVVPLVLLRRKGRF